jgi:hypothetical protein
MLKSEASHPDLSDRIHATAIGHEHDTTATAPARPSTSTIDQMNRQYNYNPEVMVKAEEVKRRFGLTPSKDALPAHLRTSSTQVEPATPPKWMTYAEAEATVAAANGWVEPAPKKAAKKERPSGESHFCRDNPA